MARRDGRDDRGHAHIARLNSSQERRESHIDKLDRQFSEVLQELRVSQTGVQILFAFLLILAFSSRFETISDFGRAVYIVTLLSTAVATACFIAPVPYHRIMFRRGMRSELVDAANRYARAGLIFLLISIGGSILLVTDIVLGSVWAGYLTAAVVIFNVTLWYVIPLWRRAKLTAETTTPGAPTPPKPSD